MKNLVIAAMLLLLTSPTLAQQQQQISPSDAALQIISVANAMAQAMNQEIKTVDDLQKQLAAANARIKELEKPEAKKD